MQAMVLIAHGSRRQASNQEVLNLASRLSHSANETFQLVQTGFLELAEPSIPQAIESCIAAGAKSIVLVPYFLAAGRHVTEDIPRIVEGVTERHPNIVITMAEHIGMSDEMSELIHASANRAAAASLAPALQQTA